MKKIDELLERFKRRSMPLQSEKYFNNEYTDAKKLLDSNMRSLNRVIKDLDISQLNSLNLKTRENK